jgi:hypothetical protein
LVIVRGGHKRGQAFTMIITPIIFQTFVYLHIFLRQRIFATRFTFTGFSLSSSWTLARLPSAAASWRGRCGQMLYTVSSPLHLLHSSPQQPPRNNHTHNHTHTQNYAERRRKKEGSCS